MTTTNLWAEFQGVLPASPIAVAQVIAHNADGRTSIVEYPNGSQTLVRGQGVAVSSYAFIRAAEIIGEAPAVSPVTLDV